MPNRGEESVNDEDVDPVAALHRIAYCLDRILVEGHRVQAYLRAAAVVAGLPPGELEARHAAGTLTELAGIGPKTASIITQALDGGPIPYLEELEATTVIEPTEEGAAALRAALRGDCHTHSTWSDGGASVETMARAAMALGHDWMVLTDHSARLTVAHGLNAERLRAQLREVRELNERLAPFRILTGMEVDILLDGSLDLDDDLLGELDVVVASVHSKLSMPAPDMTRRMVTAVASPHVDVLGHCTGQKVPGRVRPVGRSDFPGRVGSTFDAELVFAACARFDTAVEINCRPERQDPPDHLLDLALEWGCRVAIDTDAHAPGQLEWQAFGCDRAVRHGIPADQVVNTMAADELVAWAGSHPVS
jgi:putative hydrolase